MLTLQRLFAALFCTFLLLLQIFLWKRSPWPRIDVDDVHSSSSSDQLAAVVVHPTESMTHSSRETTTTTMTLSPQRKTPGNNKTMVVPTIGFIRIAKTASTSLHMFLRYYSGLQPVQPVNSSRLECYYQFVSNNTRRNSNNYTEMEKRKGRNQCLHYEYDDLVRWWRTGFVELHAGNYRGRQHQQQQQQQRNGSNPHVQQSLLLHMIVMVREPFDWLRSFFYYTRNGFLNDIVWCHDCYTPAQKEMIISGDFEAWMRLLHIEKDGPMFQYEYLDKDVDKAIAILGGKSRQSHDHDAPPVTVYLQHCFEASLRLMEKQFPLPNADAVDKFVSSTDFISNDYPKPHISKRLRALAKEWFAEEYKFYDAAVAQFLRELSSFGIDSLLLQQQYHCIV